MGSSCSTGTAPVVPLGVPSECSICLETMDPLETVTTNCRHAFCSTCIRPWVTSKGTCPCCRAEITMLMTPRTLLIDTKMKLQRERNRAKVRAALLVKQRKERTEALRRLATTAMHIEIDRLRREGFEHEVQQQQRRRPRRRRRHRISAV